MNYYPTIDFEEASRMWLKNKKKHENCTYTYVCGYETLNGTPCQNKPYTKNKKQFKYCHIHYRKRK